MMSRSRRSLEISVRAYRMLLRAYPASFRRQYAREMVQVFGDMAEAAAGRHGVLGLVALWFRIVPDLVFTIGVQQLAETERRITMWREFWGPAHFLAALGVALFIAAMVTPADPGSQILVGIPLFAIYLFAVVAARIWRKRDGSGCPEGEPDCD